MTHRLFSCVSIAIGILGCSVRADADLAHRYSFNDGTANDSVSTANGTIIGPASVSSGVLHTSSGGYATLPSTATQGITSSFTVEQWYTFFGSGGAQISFGFGLSGNTYLLSHPSFNGGHSVEYFNATAFLGGSGIGAAPINTLLHLVTTYDASAGAYAMFVNGVLVASVANPNSFNLQTAGSLRTDIGGRGPWNDPSLNGTIDEFRIWDQALTGAQIAASYSLGPNQVLPTPSTAALLGLGGLLASRRRR